MIVVRLVVKRSILCLFIGALLTMLTAASPALALSPWWHLSSGSRPASLQPGPARDDVQKLTVSATKGDIFLVGPESVKEIEEGIHGFEEVPHAIIPFDATAKQVQEHLETEVFQSHESFPSRKVLVTGGPGDEEGTKSYFITFPGQSVGPVFASAELAASFGGEALSCEGATGSGCTHEATVTELQKGAPTEDHVVVTAANVGDANVNGGTSPVKIRDTLPARVQAVEMEALAGGGGTLSDGPVACDVETLTCTFEQPILRAYDQIEVRIGVEVEAGAGGANEVSVSGGGAQNAQVRRPLRISGAPAPFGVESYEVTPEEEGGATDTQAGSHPFQLTTTLTLNQNAQRPTPGRGELEASPVALAKDLNFKLPPGLIGNPNAFPRCTLAQFFAKPSTCPPQTVLGVAITTIDEPESLGLDTITSPVYNLEPTVGEPARFGFIPTTAAQLPASTPVFLDTSVRTGGDYGVTVSVQNITQIVSFLSNTVTFWGVPGDARHDNERGEQCLEEARLGRPCQPLAENNPPPFLALPTSCAGPLQTSVEADSWKGQGVFSSVPSSEPPPAMDGCNRLPFSSEIKITPDGQAASTPSGLTADVHVTQEEALNPAGLAPADVKDIAVALPEGLALNPAAADGLQSCSEAQIGFQGVDAGGADIFSSSEPSCPDASKIANVTIKTPLLPDPLKGAMYLASPQNFTAPPQENPFSSLVAMYLVARDPVSGVLVKLPGSVSLSETGQITATFDNGPQLPFEDAELEFFGGDRAPLATPSHCGSYTTNATFAPWSGDEAVVSSSNFQIASGPNGSPCPGASLPFAPSLTAGTTNIQSAALSPFTMTMSREDGNQSLQAISLHMPPGLSGLLSGVELCPEPQANQGLCSANSLIGETTVSVGLGGDPFSVKGGRVYITGPYEGAPFGLSIVNPAKAGPFDLEKTTPCDCVVVRAKIEVDPITAALTVTSDNSGPFKIPTILDGIPLQIKHVNVTIDRPGFTFNPSNCDPMAITGSLTSTQGASSSLSVPFQVTNCATLGFKPKFSVSTSGKTSRANGASLHVKLVYPSAPFGSQANIGKVKVDLPKQLPSRLTTLQKACPDGTFNQNPAACSPQSRIGEAKATTPLLPVPLSGPAYFVSHGGAKFPELVIVLSGYGVTVQLHAETFITPAGVTSSTFRTIPDVPVGTFELTLPQGRYSALAANGNLCKSTLKMPTAFTAQNGAVIHQSTPIGVSGCAKQKAKAGGRRGRVHRSKKG